MPTPALDSGQFSSEVSQFVVDHRRSRAEPAPGVRTGYVETLPWDSRDPVPPLLIHGDTVTMRRVRTTYATPTWSENVAFDVDLVTDLSNVVSIRRDSYNLHRGGIGWVIGGLAIIAGAAGLGYFMYSVHPDAAQGYGIEGYALAGLSAVLGGGVTWHGINLLATPNEHFQEWPTR